ncbi:uncharacterized protein B0H64DRAFT_397454 [Chaetomium fimeti]|uniref:Uncharacterized protein n=1 Tax=Chaetomium fimeti TaxID=1854472 RepID=A0AAE0HGN4_9PEZI|nr:hypothetical protein B0H64DRAFT_397454 [Chaetomium fimeti]
MLQRAQTAAMLAVLRSMEGVSVAAKWMLTCRTRGLERLRVERFRGQGLLCSAAAGRCWTFMTTERKRLPNMPTQTWNDKMRPG